MTALKKGLLATFSRRTRAHDINFIFLLNCCLLLIKIQERSYTCPSRYLLLRLLHKNHLTISLLRLSVILYSLLYFMAGRASCVYNIFFYMVVSDHIATLVLLLLVWVSFFGNDEIIADGGEFGH